jgi:environmental stress-induced protein Ves
LQGHMREDRFNHEVKSLELWRKANVKVLAVLGFVDSKGEVDFSENTAEEDAEQRMTLVAHQEKVSGEVLEAVQLDKALLARLEAREFTETTYHHLLRYLDTLPEFDKDGVRMSIASLKDYAKMLRRKANQLAINRIQVRFEMERPIASNDAFLGKSELMRVSGLLRTCMLPKAFMLLFKHAEQSKYMRAIGEKIGFNSTASLRQKTIDALRANYELNREMRVKIADATKFLSRSVTIRDECFRLWVHAHRLDKTVGKSALKALANGARTLKLNAFTGD